MRRARHSLSRPFAAAAVAASLVLTNPAVAPAAQPRITPFAQAVAETASGTDDLTAFYRANGFAPVWVGDDAAQQARRAAFLSAVEMAPIHGLPAGRYDADDVRRLLSRARSPRDLGRAEVTLSRMFLDYARDLQTGILVPRQVDSDIKRDVAVRGAGELLSALETTAPATLFRSLVPGSAEYTRLVGEKMRLERLIAAGGWGLPVPEGKYEAGQTGPGVLALRDRLVAMGYLPRNARRSVDAVMVGAVRDFQADHGLAVDGVAGGSTIAAINVQAEARLGQVLVAMERERWLNIDRGPRHVWVNLTDFRARIVEDGETVFETPSVIGKADPDTMTPEFSDVMEHMVINPSWYVPRSIVVNEYLPQLRQNPGAVSHIDIVDRRGRKVNRARGFAQYSASSFPFSMRQPPGPRNALGRVKFMFPNKYNIYLHDTPAKSLFDQPVRAFSHGCIRLGRPFEFAYALLAEQEADPVGFFQSILNTGRERRVTLDTPLPVHLVYRTAYGQAGGRMQYRGDIYGRDAKVLDALRGAGVELPGVRG